MTKEKLLKLLAAEPALFSLFKDITTSNLFKVEYFGMGEHFAFSADDIEELVDDLLEEGTLATTERLVGCREMQTIKQDDGIVKSVPTFNMRSGYSIAISGSKA
jgi:hypothetical protein